jgi:Fic family protein
MFEPRFTISNRLLSLIKRVAKLGADLNQRPFPELVMINLEKSAREISSFASTSIEGNPLPLTEVKKILKNKPQFARDSEKEVLNYNQALKWLNKQLDTGHLNFNLALIVSIQQQVTDNLLPKNQSGQLRKLPVIVNNPKTSQVVFLPPDVADVKPLMQDLIDFVNQHKETIDPLILAGIFHKQMVLIHPFMDGNGRTARLATKALLANLGLDTFHLFSFENYYNQSVSKYFDIVGEYGNYYEIVDKIDFTGWLEYFTEGIIDELLRVSKLLPQVNLTPESQLASHHDKIIGFLNTHQFITDKDYAKMVDRAKATRALDFNKLIKLNIIERRGKGRSTYYTLREKK